MLIKLYYAYVLENKFIPLAPQMIILRSGVMAAARFFAKLYVRA